MGEQVCSCPRGGEHAHCNHRAHVRPSIAAQWCRVVTCVRCRAPRVVPRRGPLARTGSAVILEDQPAPHGPERAVRTTMSTEPSTRRPPTTATPTPRRAPPTPACACWSRRQSLAVAGVAVAGTAGLTACGAEGAGGAVGGILRRLGRRVRRHVGRAGAIAAAEIPVGGGKVFEALKVVVTQPTAGDFKAFSAVCTHQACTVGRRRGRRHHLPVPRQPVRHDDRRGDAGPGHQAAARQVGLRRRRRDHRLLTRSRRPHRRTRGPVGRRS